MRLRRIWLAVGLTLTLTLMGGAAWAETPSTDEHSGASVNQFIGSLVGFVGDKSGVPQMGASILLYNQNSTLSGRTVTNEKGAFGFDGLAPGLYSVRVSMASFVPALKQDIRVQPGIRSFLSVDLASVLSSIELIYSAPGGKPLMSEDWKWVLRTASATRPALRLTPETSRVRTEREVSGTVFSDTRGVVKVSTGEGGSLAAAGTQADLGTAFALATSLYGANEIQFTGNFGYASGAGVSTAGFRTSLSRGDLFGRAQPRLNVTMRQVYLPTRVGVAAISGGEAPLLRTLSVSTLDKRQIRDNLLFEYGTSLESVTYLDRLNYLSPYARLTYDIGSFGAFQLAYSSGMPPAELLVSSEAPDLELRQDLTVLATFPRLSLRGGDTRVQRATNFEAGWQKAIGLGTLSVGAYSEAVTNAAVMMAAPGGFFLQGDLLPDLGSSLSVFNLGEFERLGFTASLTQQLTEDHTVAVAYGNEGVLEPGASELELTDPDELRTIMGIGRRDWVALRYTGLSPRTGTKFSVGYKWTDYGSLAPVHLFLTQSFQPDLGFNFAVSQPLPALGFWRG
ncbi:carboxypeptidase regulatory-like domain-containing protein, partial [candidate division WOR-3 bacterium]|nr:carboxypeptidase regulatory-like domain-containing protein [candidate division WOR-3 bacterium]